MMGHTRNTKQLLRFSVPPQTERLSTILYRKGADAIIQLHGVLSYQTGQSLTDAIKDALAMGAVEYIILDMAEMGHVTQEAVDTLLMAKGLAKAHGARMVLANTTNYVLHLYKVGHFGSDESDVMEISNPIANKLYLASHP